MVQSEHFQTLRLLFITMTNSSLDPGGLAWLLQGKLGIEVKRRGQHIFIGRKFLKDTCLGVGSLFVFHVCLVFFCLIALPF